jgi:hypothetical protein
MWNPICSKDCDAQIQPKLKAQGCWQVYMGLGFRVYKSLWVQRYPAIPYKSARDTMIGGNLYCKFTKVRKNERTMYLLGDPNARLCHGLQQVSATKQHHPHLFCTNIPPGCLWSYRASMLIANHHNCWLVWHKYLEHQHSMGKKAVKLPSAAKARELTAASTRLSTVSVRW